MKKLSIGLLLLLVPTLSMAASGAGVQLMSANVDLSDRRSLQRGAKLFVNYCLSCHSAKFMRYNRMGRDLGLTDDQVRENLMFTTDKVGDVMTVSMRPEDGKHWFGAPPPDLSVIARVRGADWLYTYLLSFYEDKDPTRPYGVNNLVFENVGMPHVLWELQGTQVLKEHNAEGGHGGHNPATVEERLELKSAGLMTPAEFQRAMRDLVNFLVYMGEPAKLVRYDLGWWVLGFLVLLFVVSYALKKEYWKDVH